MKSFTADNLLEKDTAQLVQVALGSQKADLAVTGGRLLNVYTGELLENVTVSVKGSWIAHVGPDGDHTIGPKTKVIDATGKVLIPGLIDGHTHLAWLYGVDEFLKHALPGGTTTIVTEAMEPFPVAGLDGVLDFLDALKDQPAKIFATAPFMASISRAARGMPIDTLKQLLDRSDILGVGESYWQSVLQEPDISLPVLDETFRRGKTLEGHSAGARGKKLAAYLAAGISSCHEPILPEEVLERLRLGIYVMVREGSIRRDLEAISVIKDSQVDLRRLVLVTDGIEPGDLLQRCTMAYVVQKAIDCGFDPVAAVQMATLNVAEHFAIDGMVGGIAPGRCADLLILPDIRTIEAEKVISNGKVVAENGRLSTPPRRHAYRHASLNTVKLPGPVSASDFVIRPPQAHQAPTVRIIELVTDLVTAERQQEVSPVDGEIRCSPADDIIKVAAVDRCHTPGKTATGLIKGFGLRAGAFACSAAWDSSDIIVVGVSEADMAAAVNRIGDLQGGAVVVKDGTLQAEIPLPIFGLMSPAPVEVIVEQLAVLKQSLQSLGVTFADPLLTLVTLTGAAIPYLRICEEGLVNLKDGKTVGLFVESAPAP
ncbi:MAG: adenosine deaminase [Deltaproteobacteria bacterium SG8_13]|nr:MAG: adenosine deaminase [Deltaproteobacteria bacterium SG8_13]